MATAMQKVQRIVYGYIVIQDCKGAVTYTMRNKKKNTVPFDYKVGDVEYIGSGEDGVKQDFNHRNASQMRDHKGKPYQLTCHREFLKNFGECVQWKRLLLKESINKEGIETYEQEILETIEVQQSCQTMNRDRNMVQSSKKRVDY